MSTFGEAWSKGWRLAINGLRGRQQLTAYASLLVDKARDWAQATVLRGFPSFADSFGLGLLASDRVLEFDPNATDTVKAQLLLAAPTLWSYAGTPTGILCALHIAGFPEAMLVQQNGLAFQIGASPNFDDLQVRTLPTWITRTVQANNNPNIPASTDGRPAIPMLTVPWWTFDAGMDGAGNQYTSRFAIAFDAAGTGSADLTVAANLARLRRVVKTWRDGKAKFMGVYVRTAGVLWGQLGLVWGGFNWGGSMTFYSAE